MRNIRKDLATAYTSEFEDVVREVEGADLLALEQEPIRKPGWFRSGLKRRAGISIEFIPRPVPQSISQDYDLLLFRCRAMVDLLLLSSVQGWRDRCRRTICWIEEPYGTFERGYWESMEMLSRFDHVVIGLRTGIDPISSRLKRPCFYGMPAVDALRFCPHPENPPRFIDVYWMGRRAENTHQALLSLADKGRIYYVYDSSQRASLIDARQHRLQLAGFIKRSRYFIANKPILDRPEAASAVSEVPTRYFEGAAAGSIMIGDPPESEEFRRAFDWAGAVTPLPYGSSDIARVLDELDREPERVKRIRRDNTIQCLLRHDWVHRWEEVLQLANLPRSEGMVRRQAALRQLAEGIQHEAAPPTASAVQDAQVH
jgi:hypothetical protein